VLGASQIYVYATRTKGALSVIAPTTSNLGLLHMESREAASYRCSVIDLQPQSVFLATVANAGTVSSAISPQPDHNRLTH